MSVLVGVAWLFSYLCTWCLFVYFGYRWSQDIGDMKATAFWLLMSIVLGVVGGLIASRTFDKSTINN